MQVFFDGWWERVEPGPPRHSPVVLLQLWRWTPGGMFECLRCSSCLKTFVPGPCQWSRQNGKAIIDPPRPARSPSATPVAGQPARGPAWPPCVPNIEPWIKVKRTPMAGAWGRRGSNTETERSLVQVNHAPRGPARHRSASTRTRLLKVETGSNSCVIQMQELSRPLESLSHPRPKPEHEERRELVRGLRWASPPKNRHCLSTTHQIGPKLAGHEPAATPPGKMVFSSNRGASTSP